MRILTYITLILIIVLGASFAMLNSQVVEVHYFLGHRTLPLSLLLVAVFASGCILGILIAGALIIKTKMQSHQLRKRLKISEKEIENLRAIPIQNTP